MIEIKQLSDFVSATHHLNSILLISIQPHTGLFLLIFMQTRPNMMLCGSTSGVALCIFWPDGNFGDIER